jgi:TonB family protein
MTAAAALVLRSSLVLGIGLIALWAARKQPASLRHLIMVVALFLAASQPIMSRVVPAWHVTRLSNAPAPLQRAASAGTDISFTIDSLPPASRAPRSIDWPRVVFNIWAVGVVISIAVLLAAAGWLLFLGARSSEAGEAWQQAAADLRTRLRIRYPIRIAITPHPALLVTWGAIRPVILLPADAAEWTPERIELVLAHEMAHLIRRDWLIQLAAECVRAINWFNPLFWIACARLRRESEFACDDIVLNCGIGGTAYASHLVDLARAFSMHGRTWLPAPSIARPSTLERRVRAMLNPQLDRRPVSRWYQCALALLLLAIALPIAAASQATSTPAGHVTDRTGRPLVEATVRLTPANGGNAIETKSDANGDFQFQPIATGDYMLAVIYPGFSGSRQRLSLTGGPSTIQFQVQVGTLRERITVESAAPEPKGKHEVPAPPTPSCSATQSGGQIIPPMKIRDVRPRYKQEWRDNRLEGEILMRATIGGDGKVRGVDVVSGGSADLEDEAMAAVGQWLFTPTYLNCEPIEVQMYVTVAFKAQ